MAHPKKLPVYLIQLAMVKSGWNHTYLDLPKPLFTWMRKSVSECKHSHHHSVWCSVHRVGVLVCVFGAEVGGEPSFHPELLTPCLLRLPIFSQTPIAISVADLRPLPPRSIDGSNVLMLF